MLGIPGSGNRWQDLFPQFKNKAIHDENVLLETDGLPVEINPIIFSLRARKKP